MCAFLFRVQILCCLICVYFAFGMAMVPRTHAAMAFAAVGLHTGSYFGMWRNYQQASVYTCARVLVRLYLYLYACTCTCTLVRVLMCAVFSSVCGSRTSGVRVCESTRVGAPFCVLSRVCGRH